jgi:excisionase family DNA binding protein
MPIELLTTKQTAEESTVSERTVERWISSGLLPVVRVGKVRRVRRADLEALLAAK